MPSVDDRIVRMEFDNRAFEQKIQSTMTSLAQLDKALKFQGATQGFSDISAAAEKVHFGAMGNAIEDVSKKFIALTTIAVTALSNITSKAISAGAQFVKSFTFAPIFDGFREFETNANSIQTILANTASKGTTLEQVNDALQKLNQYSDQTIYNFAQMAKNIGTFTAAGVDLQTSVDSIKGIANLAAMSGSSSEQASSAMYQLSQAIAAGSLKLMDWNSVVASGMGGEAFKSALFETGKAMHTLTDVPVDMTFKQWEDAGNKFRETLQDGWITADVLTTTLSTFTGDMTEEMLLAKGFNEQQALAIIKTAQIAKASATEVKTFTQLIGTLKEAVGTGWADTFRIVIGNFTEAKTLFTGINNTVSGFVQRMSDSRNSILQVWKDFGGRALLIESLRGAFIDLGKVLTAIKDAFRDIFPPITADTLLKATEAFSRFLSSISPTAETLEKIHHIAQGFFAALSIGWTIIKEGVKFIAGLAKQLAGLAAPGTVGFLEKLASGFIKLQDVLVKGGGIQEFFEGLTRVVQKPIDLLKKFRDAISNLFGSFKTDAADKVYDSMGRISDRFAGFKEFFEKAGQLWQPFQDALVKISEVLGKIFDVVGNFFSDLWDQIAGALGKGDFNAILDVINTGLLGGIVLLFRNFVKNGLSVDLSGGVFEKVNGMLDQLTSNLKAMQLQVKAEVIMKIAQAVAILAGALFVLSLIDSEKLTSALIGMSVGMGALIGSFAALQKLTVDPKSAAQFGLVSVGMIALASAVLILSLAVKAFSTMSWEELLKGLVAVTALLGLMVAVSYGIGSKAGAMIAAGIGITGIAIGLTILAGALKILGTMSWGDMLKGLAGITIALLAIALVMNLMPGPLVVLLGAGLILVAIAIGMLAASILAIGKIKTEVLVKGLLGMAAGLLLIAGALNLMPVWTPVIAAGLLLVAMALIPMAQAIKMMGGMSWSEIARGLTALGGALLILAVGLTAMILAGPGAVALNIAVVGLAALIAVLKVLGKMDYGTILNSLGKLAIVLGGLAIVAMALGPALPFLFGLGAALLVLGAGFALAGGGAILLAKGLEIITKLGGKAASALKDLLQGIGEAIPALSTGLAKGLINFVKTIVDSAGPLAEALAKLLDIVINALIQLLPKAMTLLNMLIDNLILLVYTKSPQMIDAGFFLLEQFLIGMRNNIGQIVTLVADIIVKFLQKFQEETPRIVGELANTIQTWFIEVARAEGEIAATILLGVGQAFIEGFLSGAKTYLDGPVYQWILGIPGAILGWIGDAASWLLQKGRDIIDGLWNGIQEAFRKVRDFFQNAISGLKELIPNPIRILWDIGIDIITGLWNGLKHAWTDVKDWVEDKAGFIKSAFSKAMSIFSPSKEMMYIGEMTMLGFQVGLKNVWDDTAPMIESFGDETVNSMSSIIGKVADSLDSSPEFNPTITPVLDLTQVEKHSAKIAEHMRLKELRPSYSRDQAKTIARSQIVREDPLSTEPVSTGVKFEQNIYSPTQLSTSDIYKQTRNQITMAKEELSIP